ncbi:MAG: aldo/keto reductase [Acidobacteriota bacterium]|nr:aldo/keto reductase [Acidobacteriota bacterium]
MKDWNRREFIAKPLAFMAASQVLGKAGLLHAATAPAPIHRTLGKTGLSLPVVSMGVMNANMPAVVRRAYEMGIRHFDTAAVYQNGRNEEMLGTVIKDLGVRDKVVIATKTHILAARRRAPEVKAEMRSIFEGSLKRLQMDHVDILYFHNLDNADDVALEAPLEAMMAFKKEGKARFLGVSTHSNAAQVLQAATRLGAHDVVLVGLNYTMADDAALHTAIATAAKRGIGIVAMKTQAGGTAKPSSKLPGTLPACSQTALLKWVLANPHIATAIPGFTNFDQLEQNFSVTANLSYTTEEKAFLGDKATVAQAEFCRQCGQCREDCPRQVDIPGLMRTHMYAVQYGNREHARLTLALAAPHALAACSGCVTCRATCRNAVNIARKIDELKELAPVLLG